MKLIFTICSNNYLAQAKALGDSVLRHNPEYKFIICLCDKKHPDIDYSFFEPHQIIEADKLGIEKFDKMSKRYNIVELNTSIKPFVFHHLFNIHKDASYIMYFDPDTYVFDKLTAIEQDLQNNSILLTPHIYTPLEFDGKKPTENTFTQYGIYNLGFLALKRSEDSDKLLNWWKRRLEFNCYSRAHKGIFVDQLPMNFAPIFFNNVKISKNWGLNMAPWNLHERSLTFKNGKYFINETCPLIFYHFSNCNPHDFDKLSTSFYTRVNFEGNETLKSLYDSYKHEILKNKYDLFSKLECAYSSKPKKQIERKKSIYNKILKHLLPIK